MDNTKEKIYSFDSNEVVKENGNVLIDISVINLMLKLNSKEYQTKDEEVETTSVNETIPEVVKPVNNVETLIDDAEDLEIAAFKHKLWHIIRECYVKGTMPYRYPNLVIGTSRKFDICYDKAMIDYYRNDIMDLAEGLKEIANFQDLKVLRNGTTWTVLNEPADFLMTLLDAAGLIEPLETIYQSKNPEINLKRNR